MLELLLDVDLATEDLLGGELVLVNVLGVSLQHVDGREYAGRLA